MKTCAWCHEPMPGTRRRRVTCSNRCRKALSRETKRHRSSNSNQAGSVTPGDDPYVEPPRPSETRSYGSWRSDETFRRMLAAEAARSQPLTPQERELLTRQRRNPGVLLPELQQMMLDRELERMRREAAEYASHQPLKPENPLDPSSLGSLARRASESRRANRPADLHMAILRPGPSGPYPDDYANECIDKASIGW